jgi:ABC-2 type transport system ATP-binding protein
MIEVQHLTKKYSKTTAVSDLSFEVQSGQVTGFLGPNGSGKSTTMRMIMGLDRPSSGVATINGSPYEKLRFPLHVVGASLDAGALHPARSARDHLEWIARSNKIPQSRVEEVLAQVGLSEVGQRRAQELSLGMAQRLGIAAALLGDPQVLIFDEPINGLDPEGILWVRRLLKSLAHDGRTVLVSSHLMAEIALSADHLVVIGRGQLLATGKVSEFIERYSGHHVHVISPDSAKLAALLQQRGAVVSATEVDSLDVTGINAHDVGIIVANAGLTLFELSTAQASLEDAFLELTRDHTEFRVDEVTKVPA